MSRRRAWIKLLSRHYAGRFQFDSSQHHLAGRPGIRYRYTWKVWSHTLLTPSDLAKSGSEHGHQRAFLAALLAWSPEVWNMTFAIPNGRKRDKRDAGILKAEGVKAGVPDLFVAWPRFNTKYQMQYHGFFIEMKKPVVGKVDKVTQEPWHERLMKHNYPVAVAYTWEAAMQAVKEYFDVI